MSETTEIKHGPLDRKGDLEKVMRETTLEDNRKENLRFALEKACEGIDRTGLPHDTFNNFYALNFVDDEESMNRILKPLLTFEEYLKTQLPETGVKFVLKYSDPEKIKEFDELAEVINKDMDRIRKEKDFEMLKKYVDAAQSLIKGK